VCDGDGGSPNNEEIEMDTCDTPEIPATSEISETPQIGETPEIGDTPEIRQDRSAESRMEARRQRRNPNRRVRRTASRLALATAITVGVVGVGAGAASAENGDSGGQSAHGEIGAWEPSAGPTMMVPLYGNRAVKDYLGNVHIQDPLPGFREFPDDDAEPEPADNGGEHPSGDDSTHRVVEDTGSLDPHDLERALPELTEYDPVRCEDPEFAAKYPKECPGDEVPEEDPGEDPCETPVNVLTEFPEEVDLPQACDDPGETITTTNTTNTTVPPETTVPSETTTTVTTATEYAEPEVEQASIERKAESLAFTGSNLALPLIGAGLLGAGAILAGASLASRRRNDAQGEA
jgi:hypothetical protein